MTTVTTATSATTVTSVTGVTRRSLSLRFLCHFPECRDKMHLMGEREEGRERENVKELSQRREREEKGKHGWLYLKE